MPDVASAYPYLAEVVAGHVAKHGCDFAEAFEFGLNVILEGLEPFRGTQRGPGRITAATGRPSRAMSHESLLSAGCAVQRV